MQPLTLATVGETACFADAPLRSGLLIYTAIAGTPGTLGGLVEVA